MYNIQIYIYILYMGAAATGMMFANLKADRFLGLTSLRIKSDGYRIGDDLADFPKIIRDLR
jgi:hypothetical protein